MRKLKTITILGRKYKLKIESQEKITDIAGDQCEGCVDFNSDTIYIWKDLPDNEQSCSSVMRPLSLATILVAVK